MKSRCFFVIILFSFLIVFLSDGPAYPDIIWTKLFNYSGQIIEEGPDYVTIKMGDDVKKIPRNKIEDITYSQKTQLPPEQKETIQKAGKSLEKVVQEQLKWRQEHPKEYARQLKEEEEAIKKEEAQEQARLKKLQDEENREEARLQRLLEEEIRADAVARRQELEQENQAGSNAGGEAPEEVKAQEEVVQKAHPDNPLPGPDQLPADE